MIEAEKNRLNGAEIAQTRVGTEQEQWKETQRGERKYEKMWRALNVRVKRFTTAAIR